MEFDAGPSRDVGEGRPLVKEQGETGALPEVSAGGAAAEQVAGPLEELVREVGAVER